MKRIILFVLLFGASGFSAAQTGLIPAMPAPRLERIAVLDQIDFQGGRVVIGGQRYRLAPGVRLYGVKKGESPLRLARELRNSRVAYALAGSAEQRTVTAIRLLSGDGR